MPIWCASSGNETLVLFPDSFPYNTPPFGLPCSQIALVWQAFEAKLLKENK